MEWLTTDRARVTARLPVDDLEELFGTTIEAEDVETVGGLLAHASAGCRSPARWAPWPGCG